MTDGRPAGGVTLDALLAHRAWVRALARRLVSDPDAADDVEQETWRMALERPPRHAASLRGWLGAVVRNAARMAGRGRARRARHETAAARPEGGGARPDDLVAEAELQHRLVGEVLALAEPYRTTILQRFFEGRDAAEVAERTGVPVETVRTRTKRAVAMLRERMDDGIGDDAGAWALLCLGAGADRPPPGPQTAGTPRTTAVPFGAAGGMAMGIGIQLGVGAAVVLAAVAVWALVGRGGAADRADVAAVGTPDAAGPAGPRPPRTPATRAGHGDSATADPATHAATSAHPPVDLDACDRDFDLCGVVVRRDGAPVADAEVRAVTYPWRRATTLNWAGISESVLGPETTTAADGTFALRLTRGENVALRVSKAGLATTEFVDRQAGERVRLVVGPGVRLIVTAKDAAGAAAEGVRLRVWRMMPRDGGLSVDVSGATDVAGTCVFADLPGGADVRVMPESRLGNVGMSRVVLPEFGETTLDLVLPAGRTIRGRVTDAATGAPVAGARIGMGWPQIQAVASAADGTYALEGWTGNGFSDVHATADGYVRRAVKVTTQETIDLALAAGIGARGRVLGPDGAPAAGACVSLLAMWREADQQQMSSADARTGADGVFHVAGLDVSRPHVLTVVARGAGRVQTRIALPPHPAGECDLGDVRLPAPRAVEGVVLGDDGAPAARVAVTLTGPASPELAAEASYGGRESRFTDDLGRFRFPDLAPGAYDVAATLPGMGSPTSVHVVLTAERDVTDLRIPEAQAASGAKPTLGPLTIVVVDETGAPVAGASVVGLGPRRQPAQGVTGVDGRLRLPRSAAEPIRQVAVQGVIRDGQEEPWLAPPPVAVADDAAECTVRVRHATRVMYVVLDPSGAPVPRAAVTVDPSDAGQSRGFTDADGRGAVLVRRDGAVALDFDGTVYEGERFVPRDTGLAAHVDGVTTASGDVVLRCVRFETGRTMTVRVLEADGRSVEGVAVSLWAGAYRSPQVATDAEGRARFADLAGRTLHVGVQIRPGDLAPGAVSAVPEGQEVVVRLPAGVDVSGTVTWSSGDAVANASVQVMDTSSATAVAVSWAQTDAAGRFRVRVPAESAATYEVVVGFATADGQFHAVRQPFPAGERDVRIVLPR